VCLLPTAQIRNESDNACVGGLGENFFRFQCASQLVLFMMPWPIIMKLMESSIHRVSARAEAVDGVWQSFWQTRGAVTRVQFPLLHFVFIISPAWLILALTVSSNCCLCHGFRYATCPVVSPYHTSPHPLCLRHRKPKGVRSTPFVAPWPLAAS
jgi:hypothetical protein